MTKTHWSKITHKTKIGIICLVCLQSLEIFESLFRSLRVRIDTKFSFYVLFWSVIKSKISLVYKIFLKNALYLVFNWFQLILGRWFRIRSPFSAVWSEFCSVASFVFFGLENQIFEIFENLANFFWKLVTYS